MRTLGTKRTRMSFKSCRGQGMIEYLLVLTVVVFVTVTALTMISGTVANLINGLVTNIQSITGVPAS